MFGVVELRRPINIPIHLTVGKGNLADQVHFLHLVGEVIDDLRDSSTLIFDAGGDNKNVTDLIMSKGHSYVTRKKLNSSDKDWMGRIQYEEIETVTDEVVCVKHRFGSGRCIYLFYSSQLHNDKLRTIDSMARKKVADAMEFIKTKKDGRICISKAVVKKVNPLFDVEVSVQTKLLGDEHAMLEYVRQRLTKGTEGFFKLESSKELTADPSILDLPRKGHGGEAHRVVEEPHRDQAPQMLERGFRGGYSSGRIHGPDDGGDDPIRTPGTEESVNEIPHQGVGKVDSNVLFGRDRPKERGLFQFRPDKSSHFE